MITTSIQPISITETDTANSIGSISSFVDELVELVSVLLVVVMGVSSCSQNCQP